MVEETLQPNGASSFHTGIDIGAPAESNLIASRSGKVTFLGFQGGNGYTISIESGEYTFSYSHVNPNFIVHIGQIVEQGQIIGKVGPKNVYGVPNNPYRDSNGNPTNGATTGPHLHFSIRKNGELVNPLNYLK